MFIIWRGTGQKMHCNKIGSHRPPHPKLQQNACKLQQQNSPLSESPQWKKPAGSHLTKGSKDLCSSGCSTQTSPSSPPSELCTLSTENTKQQKVVKHGSLQQQI